MLGFIKTPEIQLVINSKSLPSKQKANDGAASHPAVTKQVKFNEWELDLLKKVRELKIDEKTSTTTNENIAEKSSKKDKTTSLSLADVKRLKEELGEGSYLCDVIAGAQLILPENEIIARNPVLEKRIQRLKAEQEQRVYNTMTKNVDSSRRFMPEETIAFQSKF